MSSKILKQEVVFEKVGDKDLKAIAHLHRQAFPKSSLTLLGEGVVQKYYKWQLVGPHQCFALGAFVRNELSGFVFSGVFCGAMSGFLAKNKAQLVMALFIRPWLFFHPEIQQKIKRALKIIKKSSKQSEPKLSPENAKKSFGILSIAVAPHLRGKGLGFLLMEEAEKKAKNDGFHQMHLTVEGSNQQAVLFYERQGWSKKMDKGVWNGRMSKESL